MNEELLRKAMDIFDTPEKWNSFLELCKSAVGIIGHQNTEIQGIWWRKLQNEVYSRELKNTNPDWEIYIWNNWDIMWYLKEFSDKSICIHFYGEKFRVFYDYGFLDINKVNELVKDPKFDIIKNTFDKIDGSDHQTIAWVHRNYSFGSIYDGNFPNSQTLAWYAGNRTSDFADQIINDVRKLQTPEITALFREINEKCQKD